MEYKDRIKAARKHAKLTQAALADAVGIKQASISELETGKSQSSTYNATIAKACGVDPVWLETGRGSMLPPTTGEIESNVEGGPIKLKTGLVPVVGKAKLGLDGFFEEMGYPPGGGDGYLKIYSDDPDAYALRVVGSSMEPRIRSGEFVLVEPGNGYVAGDEVLVKTTDGQSMIKVFMYHRDGEVRLLSVNDAHPPLTVPEASITKIHPVGAIVKASRLVEL